MSIVPLKLLQEKERGIITGFLTQPSETAKLAALGLLPGLTITLLQRYPSYVVAVGETQYAVDTALASQIQVERLD